MENNKDLHEMYIKLMALGATKEDIIELWRLALETIGTKKKEQA